MKIKILKELCWETKEEKCIVLIDDKTDGAEHAQLRLINKTGNKNSESLETRIKRWL